MARAVKVKEEDQLEVEDVEQEVEVEDVEEVEEVLEEEEWDSHKMPPEEEVWPGGPTFATLNRWKDQYGDVYVTSVTPDRHVAWRTINRFEYRRMVKNLEQALATGMPSSEANMNNEESIAELCILFPVYSRANPAGEMAGVASTVSQQIMEASAFSTVEVRQL